MASKRGTRVCARECNVNIISRKRSQLTIFIIIAIVIVAGVVSFFLLKDKIFIQKFPTKFQPIETYFLDCINQNVEEGKNILESHGGYIYLPKFEPGSQYRPFSSQLSFQGMQIPYWYYASGNNLIKEQMPTKADMEKQLERYVQENLDCDFSSFEEQGYSISLGKPSVDVKINDLSIDTTVNIDLSVQRENDSARQTSHTAKLDTKLGKLYSQAATVYNYEKKKAFLEDYAVDVLRNYAPVDGVEITCAPKVWLESDIDSQLKLALEANMQAIKLKGDYYQLANKQNKYFVQDLAIDDSIRFTYSGSWPTRIEVWDAKNGILIANPIGTQQGLGVLGFCYVPYHFVYDINYPVLVQLYDAEELFQFPVAVIIEKNKQRQSLNTTEMPDSEPELCNYKNQDITVYTYNSRLEGIEADIGFECLGQKCDIGETKLNEDSSSAVLNAKFPQCANGFVTAKAEGYSEKTYLFSTNQAGIADVVLDKLYNVSLDLKLDSEKTDDFAIISFVSKDNSATVVWPQQKTAQLSQGDYNVSVYVYRDYTITIPAVKKEQCVETAKSGLAGIFGMTEEKCYTVDIPSQTISNTLAGGGKTSEYFTEDLLENRKIEISVNSFGIPKNTEELQASYNMLEVSKAYLDYES